MMKTNPRIGLTLSPLDTLFFRDGRPFEATSRASTTLPQPQTFAGAIRTELLARYEGVEFAKLIGQLTASSPNAHLDSAKARTQKFHECNVPAFHDQLKYRGPWLAIEQRDHPIMPLLPVPATLARKRGQRGANGVWYQAKPTLVNDRWLLWRTDDEPDADAPGGFLTLQGIKRFLAGKVKDPDESLDDEWFPDADVYDFDNRTGVGINPDSLTGIDSNLFGRRMLALNPKIKRKTVANDPYEGAGIVLYGEIVLPDAETRLPPLECPIPLGGEGRCVQLSKLDDAVDWGCALPATENGRRLWLLASAGIFPPKSAPNSSSRPDCFTDDVFKVAASSAGVAVSGWDSIRRGPKPTRFAVPAGAVYFTEGPVHVSDQSLCSDPEFPELIAEGWGHVLEGVWQ